MLILAFSHNLSHNAHGDVVQLTNSSGNVTQNYRYDAFGVEQNPDENDTNPWRYCGEYFDRETGTIYNILFAQTLRGLIIRM